MAGYVYVFRGKKPVAGIISYILRPGKATYYTVMNLIEDVDYSRQFKDTMAVFGRGKEPGEIKYFHFVLCDFARDNPLPEKALDYAACVMRTLMPGYEIVIAVHTDTDTVHAHAIVNAIDPVTGQKPDFSKADLIEMKKVAEKIAISFGFHPSGYFPDFAVKRCPAEKYLISRGKPCWKEDIREVVQEAKETSHSEEEFMEHLKEYDVKIVKSDTDYLYLHPETNKIVWGKTLGNDFTKQEVLKHVTCIEQNRNATESDFEGISVVHYDDGENIVGGSCEATDVGRGNAGVGNGGGRDDGNFAAEGNGDYIRGISGEGRTGTGNVVPARPEYGDESAGSVRGGILGGVEETGNKVLGNGSGTENVGKGGKRDAGNSDEGRDAIVGKSGEGFGGVSERDEARTGDGGRREGGHGLREGEDNDLETLRRLRELSDLAGINLGGHYLFSDEYLYGGDRGSAGGTSQKSGGRNREGELASSDGNSSEDRVAAQQSCAGADGQSRDVQKGAVGRVGEAEGGTGSGDEGASSGAGGGDTHLQRMPRPEDERNLHRNGGEPRQAGDEQQMDPRGDGQAHRGGQDRDLRDSGTRGRGDDKGGK